MPTLTTLYKKMIFFILFQVYTTLVEAVILDGRDVPKVESENYDFIVVGGGTAGNVVANRLTENPNFNVLLLEAGSSDAGIPRLQIPFLCAGATPKTPWDWNYTTVPQPGLNGAAISYPRGHVLGGSSSVNCLVYTRGSKSDFDRYANVTGDAGWSWENMLPYFKKSEIFTPPPDRHNTIGEFNPSVHGFNGLLSVSLPGAPTVIDSRFTQAIEQLGGDFKQNIDYNSGSPLGFGWLQAAIDGPSASRSSSSTGYLARGFLLRPNLHVLLNAQVSRILETGNESGLPSFTKVEYRLNKQGPFYTASAGKEVILSAGSVNTPQVLLNSGIGHSAKLKSLGIKPLVNLKDVGENLSDHPIFVISWLVNSTATYDKFIRNSTIRDEEIQVWEATREGPLVNGISQHIGFIRLPDNSTIFKTAPNPSSGPDSPNFEIFLSNFLLGTPQPTGNFMSIPTIMLTPGPTARGSVNINSTDPFSVPIIDAGLLIDPTDLPILREAVRSILRLSTAPAWSDFIVGPADPTQPNITSTDDEIDLYLRAKTRSAYHVVGTSSMSPKGSANGVVDPDLKVKNISGVRVVDASILPYVPAGHTQASTYALAERAADLIKADV